MLNPARRSALLWTMLLSAVFLSGRVASAQVFTVGEQSATADINTTYKATNVELPSELMSELTRRDLIRNFAADQGFARRTLPLGTVLTLVANGNVKPAGDDYRKLIYKKGQAAAAGDRVAVTALKFEKDRILIDINGGPYAQHRFLQHVQIGVGGAMTQQRPMTTATGLRIALVFEGPMPAVTAPEVQALLAPLVDFGARTGEVAYADTLPAPIKSAIASHKVLVGMSRRMVLAALGEPASKVREGVGDQRYEEWIYGHQPETVQFIRFIHDRVSRVEIAAMGKPLEVRNHDEMDGYEVPETTRTILVADGPTSAGDGSSAKPAPPSLRKPGEGSVGDQSVGAEHKVQFPDKKPDDPAASTPISPAPPSSGSSPQ